MAELLINQWEGIGNDEYLQQGSELFDAENIDLSSSRVIKSNGAYSVQAPYLTSESQYGLRKATVNTYTNVFSYTNEAKIYDKSSNTLRGIGYPSHTHITVGTGNGTYAETTASSNMRHFFFPYNSARIVYTNWNGTTVSSIDTSAYPRLNDSSLAPGASCYLWKGAIIFSYGNSIHEINPSPNTAVYTGEKVVLQNGAQVKHIAYFGGMIWFVYTIDGKNSTYIQGCTYDGINYKLNNYVTEVSGQVCIGATSDSGIIYWVSEKSINEFNGSQNSVVRTLYDKSGSSDYFYSAGGGAESVCSYNNGFLRAITGGGKIYSHGNKRTNYKKNLVRMSIDPGFIPIALANDGILITHDSGNHRVSFVDFRLLASSYAITTPYTAGQYGYQKSGLGIRVGYNLKKINGGSIKISIMTDRMIRNYGFENYSNYIEIANISDATKTFYDITHQMISTALGASNYSNEFSLMKLKIELVNGGLRNDSLYGEIRYSNSPEVFDLYIYHDEVKR